MVFTLEILLQKLKLNSSHSLILVLVTRTSPSDAPSSLTSLKPTSLINDLYTFIFISAFAVVIAVVPKSLPTPPTPCLLSIPVYQAAPGASENFKTFAEVLIPVADGLATTVGAAAPPLSNATQVKVAPLPPVSRLIALGSITTATTAALTAMLADTGLAAA